MNDRIDQIRARVEWASTITPWSCEQQKVLVDEVRRLQSENDRFRKALEKIEAWDFDGSESIDETAHRMNAAAREALSAPVDGEGKE